MDSEKNIDCPARDRIQASCPCPKLECSRHGVCCECIVYHQGRTQEPILKRFPACLRDLVLEAREGG